MTRLLLWSSLSLAFAGLAGCSGEGDAADPPPWVSASHLEIREGLIDPANDPDPDHWWLNRGPQGGQHIYVHLSVVGCTERSVPAVVAIERWEPNTGATEALDWLAVRVTLGGNEAGSCEFDAVLFPLADVADLDSRSFHLKVRVGDSGWHLDAETDLAIAWNPEQDGL